MKRHLPGISNSQSRSLEHCSIRHCLPLEGGDDCDIEGCRPPAFPLWKKYISRTGGRPWNQRWHLLTTGKSCSLSCRKQDVSNGIVPANQVPITLTAYMMIPKNIRRGGTDCTWGWDADNGNTKPVANSQTEFLIQKMKTQLVRGNHREPITRVRNRGRES